MPRWGSKASVAVSMAEIVAAAEAIAAERKPLTKGELGARLGIDPDWARARLTRARAEGHTSLELVTERSALRTARIRSIEGYICNPEVESRADPADLATLQAEAFRGLVDGRAERDDPGRIGGCFSGKAHASAPTSLQESCRKYLREYRVIRGRARPEPKPREVGKPHCVNVPRKPTKRRDSIMYGKQVERHHHAN
jgi:hypothetical protein